jgi:hypothetical protein
MPPIVLIDTLESVRRRVRIMAILYGVGIVIAVAAGLLLATVLLDYLLNLPPIPRLIIMVAAVACLFYRVSRSVVKPAISRLTLSDVAGKLERAFPEFDDRLRSTVDFLTKGTPGSVPMKNRVVGEATALAQKLQLGQAVQTRPVWQAFAGGGGAVLGLVLLAAILGPQYFAPAMLRLISPFTAHPWPKRVEIAMVDNLPDRIPVGKAVDVRIRLTRGDRSWREARVFYQYGDGRIEKEIMTRSADGVYSASLDARADASGANGLMSVWVEAGDDATSKKVISVVQRLSVASVQLLVQPPPYVNEPATPVALDTAPATVTYGSTLTLNASFNKNLDTTILPSLITLAGEEQLGKLPDVAWDAPTGTTISGHWIAKGSASFGLRATDRDGFTSTDLANYQIIVRPDQLPSIQVTRPGRNEECTPQAVVPLRAVAEDDFGIQTVKLVVKRLGEKPTLLADTTLLENGVPVNASWARLEAAGDVRRWQLDFNWDLSKIAGTDALLALKPGDVLEYHLEAQDNFAFEGKTHDPVSSGTYRITLMSQEQFSSLMNDLLGAVREQIKDVRSTQHGLKDQTTDLHEQTQKQLQFSRADVALAKEIVAHQSTAASQAKEAAQRLDELLSRMTENKSTAQDLAQVAAASRDELNQIAEQPMKEAAAQVDTAREQKAGEKDDPAVQRQKTDARNQQLASAEANQQSATDRLDQVISRMGDAGGLGQTIEQIKNILDQQRQISQKSNDVGMRNLGKRPDQMEDADRQAQQKNAGDQDALSDKTSKTLDQMMQQAEKLAKSDPAASQAMKQAAQTGQSQSVASQMQASAQSQRQNQQASAQQAQAQVEIGLQMMIRQLEEAQQRKLEALAKQLADLQAQIDNLLRQQGGLNYDNLALRGPDTLKKADAKMVGHLLDLAGWTAAQAPAAPDLDTQDRLQEQTERNTRGVSKQAESLPDAAGITSALNRAADRMGRAISAMRDDDTTDAQRLAAAYDPPQTEALASLEKAKVLIDLQAEKNNQALNQQKKDTIRAAYQKILETQKKIDADTVAIDKAPRGDGGQLGHRDAITLGQLPVRQSALSQQTAKLDSDLAGLNSIVYVWANKDIVDAMQGVKALLEKPDTSVATQANQSAVEDQLQAMIDSLNVKPKKSPFAQQGSGGGAGGSGKKPLPTEAELRLLKRLQQALNKTTITLDHAAAPDPAAVVSLGGRQGKLRDLLDSLLKSASHGKSALGPEPDPGDKLPEEASSQDVDNAELQQDLLKGDGKPASDAGKGDVDLVGQRMARSRQRLALDKDAGNTTQEIQKRILQNLDSLIDQAREQEAEAKPQPGQQPPQGAQPADAQANAQPQNGKSGQQMPQNGHTPAAVSTAGHDVDVSNTPNTDITQSLKEWGSISDRKRAAVMEASTEKPIQKFKEFIQQYYQALGNREAQ